MRPEAKRRLLLGAAALLALGVLGTVAGVVTKVVVDNNNRNKAQQQAEERRLAAGSDPRAAEPPAAGATADGGTADNLASAPALLPAPPSDQPPADAAVRGVQEAAVDDKAAFYPENQRIAQSIYMVLGPDALLVAAQSGPSADLASGGQLPFPYAGLGPCRQLAQYSNISLDLSAAATGCRGMQCSIPLRVTLPAAASCRAIPAPYPTVYLVSGFSCYASYYKSYADRLVTWGYAVVQYDRPMAGLFQPTSETETAYFDQIIAWRNAANRTRAGPFQGQFSSGPMAVMGHSMGGGLASILAGTHVAQVGALVLIDPVDYTQMSLRVARQFLAQYPRPILAMTAGVVCKDRNGCVPPQDHTPSAAEEAAWAAQGLCKPSWWCCDWDDDTPGLETKQASQLALETDGPSGFVEFSPPGSWLAHFGQAGHMSFLEPGSVAVGGINCPAVAENLVVLPDALGLTAAYLEAQLRGEAAGQYAMAWAASKPAQQLTLAVKGPPAAA